MLSNESPGNIALTINYRKLHEMKHNVKCLHMKWEITIFGEYVVYAIQENISLLYIYVLFQTFSPGARSVCKIKTNFRKNIFIRFHENTISLQIFSH